MPQRYTTIAAAQCRQHQPFSPLADACSLLLRMWPCVPHLCGDLRLEPLEVLPEEIREFRGLLVVVFAALPGPVGVEETAVDSGHLEGHVEAEEGVLLRLGVIELAPYHGAYHLTGGVDIYAAADTVGSAGPAGVDQVAAGAVRLQPLGEHLGVGGRRQGKERGPEARGERRLDLGLHLGLRPGELGGVAREEVVGGLRRREGAYGGQHPEGVGGQKQDGGGVDAPAFGDRARYVLQRVGDAGVLRQHTVRVVYFARAPVDNHLLQHGPKADGVPDLGFLLGTQVYRLRVAASLEVEDPGVRPAVLVVADQIPLGAGREGRLASTREPEEERDVAFFAHIGRAVHREDVAFGRQHEVEYREDALLDLPGVGRAADEDHLALEVYPDEGLRLRSVLLGVGKKSWDRDHGPVGLERVELLLGGTPEELPGEEGLPGVFGYHVDVEAVTGVRSGVGVDDVDLLEVLDVGGRLVEEITEGVAREGLVARAPVHGLPCNVVLHDKAVLRGAAGPLARPDDQGPRTRDHTLTPPHRGLDQPGRRQILVHGPDVLYPKAFQRHLANRQIQSISLSPCLTRRAERMVRVFFLSPQGF